MGQANGVIKYPYAPDNGEFGYVPADDRFMRAAKEVAREQSLDNAMSTGTVIVKGGEIIGRGANGSDYHQTHECERVKQGIPTGQGYELCEGCHPKNHSEPKAVADAQRHIGDKNLAGAEAYLWGHWWCCEPCWQAMLAAGIRKVYLLEASEILFNKQAPGNVIGRQFDEA